MKLLEKQTQSVKVKLFWEDVGGLEKGRWGSLVRNDVKSNRRIRTGYVLGVSERRRRPWR